MFCKNCGYKLQDGDKFCLRCGAPAYQSGGQESAQQNMAGQNNEGHNSTSGDGNVFSDIAGKIGKVAGVEAPTHLKLSDILSQVFKKHTEEEAEDLFIIGTNKTTPDTDTLEATWPKPWLFTRVFIIMAVCYFALYIGYTSFNNINFLPGVIAVGSFMVPIALLVFFWEMDVPRNISFYKVIKMFFFGGIMSLLITILLFSFFDDKITEIIIGIVEETGKVAAILLFIKDKRFKYILNGLLIGAAIGAGFAAFETAGYVLKFGLKYGVATMFDTMFQRAILAPGGHIVWAGLSGAALYMVKGDRDFEPKMLADKRFLRIFAIVIALHAIWDFIAGSHDLASISTILLIALSIISWIIIIAMINTGLKEISRLKKTE